MTIVYTPPFVILLPKQILDRAHSKVLPVSPFGADNPLFLMM